MLKRSSRLYNKMLALMLLVVTLASTAGGVASAQAASEAEAVPGGQTAGGWSPIQEAVPEANRGAAVAAPTYLDGDATGHDATWVVSAASPLPVEAPAGRPAAFQATLVVNSTDDTDDGACDATHCSLREAINYAASGDTITFDASLSGATIVLGSVLSINNDLTIDASAPAPADRVIISGNNATQVFDLSSTATVIMRYLEITQGSSWWGGCVENEGTLELEDVIVSWCDGHTGGGGGVRNASTGTLRLTRTTFADNKAPGANGDGGAILNSGTLLIAESEFYANSTTGWGGAIDNQSTLFISASEFYSNSAEVGGAAISSSDVYSVTTLTVEKSLFTGNHSAGDVVIVSQGSITGSTATISNTTFSGNQSEWGGIIHFSEEIALSNVTVANNTGMGINSSISATLNFTNTIIAGNSEFDCLVWSVGANSHNLVEDGGCSAALSGDPLLGPLADNGGDTLTHELLLGSPAIDAGDDLACPATDQRGVIRPKDGDEDGTAACDIGAFEVVTEVDYGDAPAPYPTLKIDNGARHYLRPGYHLGALIDVERPNAILSPNADDDDLDNLDDEDGVAFTTPLRTNDSASVDVTLTGGAGYLHAWIDFNADGDWADAGEKIIPGAYQTAGTHSFTFPIPPEAAIGDTVARFRFTSRPRLSYNGIAIDGEVEDHIVTIKRGPPVAIPDSASLDENTSVLIDVLANDYDPHGTVSLQSVGSAARGTTVIESDQIRYTPNPDYNGSDSFPYIIINDIGLAQTGRATIFVRNVNSVPTDILILDLQPLVAACNASGVCTLPPDTLVGSLWASDPDPGDTHIFNLLDSAEFRLSGAALYTREPIVFEGNTQSIQWEVTVRATDAGGLHFDKALTLYILGDKVGGGPEEINLSNNRVAENLPAGTPVGTLTTVEGTPHAPYTYALVSGVGSNDNVKFQIVGNQLQTAMPLDFEQKELNKVRVRTLSGVGQFKEQVFTIQLLDDPTEPPQPPPNCSGGNIELIDSGDVQMSVINVTASNVSLEGCDIEGDLSLSIPGWSGGGIAFQGQVDQRNQLTADAGDIAEMNLLVGGVSLQVFRPSLEFYDGRPGLRLEGAVFCLPSEWGGLCAPTVGGGVSMLIDDGGLKMGGELQIGFPDIKVGNQLNLSGLSGKVVPVPGGYEISLGGEFGLPKFKPGGASGCGLSALVTIYAGAANSVVMEIHTSPFVPSAVSLREISVGIACDVGIPIDNTGLALTGVEGTVSLRPDAQYVSLSLTVSTIKKIPVLNISPIKAIGTATLYWHPEWGLDLGAVVYMLEVFKTAETEVSIRENRISFTANISTWLVNGQLSVNAWTDWSHFHLTAHGEVMVGFVKGRLLHECVCVPYPTKTCWKWCFPYPCGWKEACGCLDIPPIDLYLTMGAEFGEFTNGAWGFKGYISLPVVGTVGIYVDSNPSLHVGGVSQYQLATPQQILAALAQWRAGQALGIEPLAPLAQKGDIRVASESQVALRVPVNVGRAENDIQDQEITPVELGAPKNTLFTLASSEPLTMTLEAPDGTVITADNYNQPPVAPTYQVEYTQTFFYQASTSADYGASDEPRLRFVLAATHPDWEEVDVSLDGVLLFANQRLDTPAPADYIPVYPGEHTLSVVPSSGGTPVVSTFTADFQTDYTALLSGDGATPDLNLLTDDHTAPSVQGKARLRFVHSAPYTGTVDVFVEGVQILSDTTYLAESAYFEFDEGEALVEIKDAVSGDDIAPAQVVDLTAGGVYSLFDAVYPQGAYPLAWSQFLDEGYIERYYTQYKVLQAPAGEWEVTLNGNLDTSMPILAVLGIANPPQWERVEAQAADPLYPELTWELQSDYLPTTVGVYANPDVYEENGEPVYQGYRIAEVELTQAEDVAGDPFTQAVDLSGLESGDYTLWVRVEDGVNPPISAYALTPGGSEVAVFSIDQSITFPTAWDPAITAEVSNAQARLFLEWEALLHPDVDSYNLYLNTQPLSPTLHIEGLSAFQETDATGQPVGPVLANASASNLVPGNTYYYSVEAVDAESGKSVRSPEASITIAGGDFGLTTPSALYLAAPGAQISFPLSVEMLQPLFYPNVGLSIDGSLTLPGMRVWFDTPLGGDAYLTEAANSVEVVVDLGATVPHGIYPVTFMGRNGALERRVTVYVLVGDARYDFFLPVVMYNDVVPVRTPDLVVQDIDVTADDIQVTIKNVGDGPVNDHEEFWVDVYIDPHTIPTGVNQRWEDLADEGLRWGVTAPALPLDPDDELTLAIGDVYYWPSFSNFGGTLAPGTTIYAQVDAHNIVTDYGAVYESHERTGGAYNNITSVVYNGATAHIKAAAQTITGWLKLLTYGNFPPLE